ncbi:MAG: hypothetical protein VKK43_00225 [Synechococcaceae cyanobacterium]|nr:hypothetical protein [Synechococcaceae cyanobacterium]
MAALPPDDALSLRSDDDPDDPLALPLPPHTLLLDPPAAADPAPDRCTLALRALRQQLRELGLPLRLREIGGDGGEGRLLQVQGCRVQLVCAPFVAEALAVPAALWRRSGPPPHLLLGAWVEEECGAVRLPGVLTAAELSGGPLADATAPDPVPLPLEAFHGGLDRLFALVRLMAPEALLPPAPAPLRLGDWLDGVLDGALLALGAELVPAGAGAFRGAAAAAPTAPAAALATVVIPLALVLGQLEAGPNPGPASERFRLLLQLCGEVAGRQWLEVRLEPELPGDLLPQRLTLQVGDRTVGTGDGDGVGGGSGPVALTLPAGQEPLGIVLTHSGGSRLALPPLHFCATLGQGEPDPAA